MTEEQRERLEKLGFAQKLRIEVTAEQVRAALDMNVHEVVHVVALEIDGKYAGTVSLDDAFAMIIDKPTTELFVPDDLREPRGANAPWSAGRRKAGLVGPWVPMGRK